MARSLTGCSSATTARPPKSERRYSIRKHPGAVRLLGYANRADAGTYAEALRLAGHTGTPDVVATRRPGTLKYGTGVNLEQEITHDIGDFHTPRLERRQDRKLRVYGHRPPGERRSFRQRHALEAERRRGRNVADGRRHLRRARVSILPAAAWIS